MLELATPEQIVQESAFPNYVEIDVKLALTTTYDSWHRVGRTRKRAPTGHVSCARTGLPMLVGPIHKILIYRCPGRREKRGHELPYLQLSLCLPT